MINVTQLSARISIIGVVCAAAAPAAAPIPTFVGAQYESGELVGEEAGHEDDKPIRTLYLNLDALLDSDA